MNRPLINPAPPGTGGGEAQDPAPRLLWLERGCFLAATGFAAYLFAQALAGGSLAGCGPGSACDRVMTSPWAYWMRIPVSALALVAYPGLLVAGFLGARARPGFQVLKLWPVMIAASVAVTGSAIWFTGVQLLLLKTLCKFCALTHLCAVTGSCLLLRRAPVASRSAPPEPAPGRLLSWNRAFGGAVWGLVLVGGLVAGQKLFPQPTSLARTYLGHFHVNEEEAPRIGPARARHRLISLFDYTCQNCREMHRQLVEAQGRLGGKFAILCLPVPLCPACNPAIDYTKPEHAQACEYARLGLAVWKADPGAYPAFDAWMFAQAPVPSLEDARQYAATLLGRERLAQASTNVWIGQMIESDVALFRESSREVKSMRLPQLILSRAIAVGRYERVEDLIRLLESDFALQAAE